jgi:hypothetical protein
MIFKIFISVFIKKGSSNELPFVGPHWLEPWTLPILHRDALTSNKFLYHYFTFPLFYL